MLVVLKGNWFIEGRRIRRGNPPSQPVEVPDHLRSKLPSDARVVEEGEVGAPIKPVAKDTTFSAMARDFSGRQSLVDYLGSNPTVEPVPEPAVNPLSEVGSGVHMEPKPEPEPEAEEPDIEDVLKAAKAAGGKGRKRK